MRILTHFKTSIPKEDNILNKIAYGIGLFVPNIIFYPFHRYECCKNFIDNLLIIAEKNQITIIKAFIVGMVNHYVGDIFCYDKQLSNFLEKESYLNNFVREIQNIKDRDIDNEITRTVNNYFDINSISNSIYKIHQVYEHMANSKCEENKRILYDYLFINNLTNKIYLSIVSF